MIIFIASILLTIINVVVVTITLNMLRPSVLTWVTFDEHYTARTPFGDYAIEKLSLNVRFQGLIIKEGSTCLEQAKKEALKHWKHKLVLSRTNAIYRR